MFGLTTPCVQAVCKQLEARYDCIVFHATGTGGQSMEKLVDSGLISGVLDVTTTEIADELVGGVLSAGPTRMDVFAKKQIPYVGSCGALDMVNFWAMETVPAQFRDRNLYRHNSNVTLMRTTAGRERAHRPLHRRQAEPHGRPGALPDSRGRRLRPRRAGQAVLGSRRRTRLCLTPSQRISESTSSRKLIRLPHHINDPAFADALVANFNEITQTAWPASLARTS